MVFSVWLQVQSTHFLAKYMAVNFYLLCVSYCFDLAGAIAAAKKDGSYVCEYDI
ncbi:hypothetical protein [Neobacillus niacini]|uniref:hypothetical protein n=1 Tax=Neobacillus niacini TaxID=86668 RepID=UPI002FFE2B90